MQYVHVLCTSTTQDTVTGRITLYMKGADSVMGRIVDYTDWLEEEVRLCA